MPSPVLSNSHISPPNRFGVVDKLPELRRLNRSRSAIYEIMFAEQRIDEAMRETLAWYDIVRSLSRFGPFRTDLATTTSRGVPYSAIPFGDWQRQAQADLDWARAQIPTGQLALFDGLIDGTLQIDSVGQRWPELDRGAARERAEKQFLLAANFLFVSSGSRRGPSEHTA